MNQAKFAGRCDTLGFDDLDKAVISMCDHRPCKKCILHRSKLNKYLNRLYKIVL